MPSCLLRRRVLSFAVAIVLGAACPLAAGAQLVVTPPAGATTLGKDLVLEFRLPAGFAGAAAELEVAVTAAGGGRLLDEAYPLRAGGQPDHFVYAAPTRADAAPGRYPLTMTVRGPGGELTWQGEVEVAFGKEWTAARITYFIQSRGLLLFLGLVFLGGVLMSATPCIYPMIPITLAVIGAQTQKQGVGKGFLLALTYGLGLAIVYGVIGVISATVFSGITAFLQSPVVLVPIALLMVAMSFAMFGAYELEAPAFLRNRLQGAGGGRAGVVGAFVAGMVAGLVASPCVGPFLAALLVWVGSTGSVLLGFWSLFIFGLGLSALLVAVGTFPSLLGSLPQSGGWMETVKRGMGLLLLYMAFFFVRPGLVLPERIFYPLLGAVTVLVAVFLGAFDHLTPESRWWDRTRKGLGILVLLCGGWLLARTVVPDLLPAPAVVAAPAAGAAAAPSATAAGADPSQPGKVEWELVRTGEGVQTLLAARIAEAGAAGKPVMIDFWATWCVYCKKLDKAVWVEPAVVAESRRFVTIKIDATKPDDEDMTAVKEMFKVPGLPTVAFVGRDGRILHAKTLSGWHEPAEFLTVMRSIE
ncbi:MAG TPA: cytochrome c biogenesis protein CcdA [Candidatus Krumholzibacteria bacterium]|nr:cytochrome c biogenesis protein CcdA [Candidatus Krumholzibacteria bacterium]HPD72804.1 cytochrome c biogenesis protein CcdA [Candidatus Krumholzibacteria bacterium]HRY40264.1 cytochrome c biogenesis protein CcdA [Candidatus Krumholzibacteria bacterium]